MSQEVSKQASIKQDSDVLQVHVLLVNLVLYFLIIQVKIFHCKSYLIATLDYLR